MFRNPWTPYVLGGGILSLLFALGRTYWLLARAKREREKPRRARPVLTPSPKNQDENLQDF
jgi:hypothetical protein